MRVAAVGRIGRAAGIVIGVILLSGAAIEFTGLVVKLSKIFDGVVILFDKRAAHGP